MEYGVFYREQKYISMLGKKKYKKRRQQVCFIGILKIGLP